MKLLTTPSEITAEFARLMDQYSKYYWAVAWAGAEFDLFSKLMASKEKICQIVVGLHFHQTHPAFIKNFIRNEKVRFYPDTEGVFHPKLFVFEKDVDEWEIFIGSPNFTYSGFNRNAEVVSVIGSSDGNSGVHKQARDFVRKKWEGAEVFDEHAFDRYNQDWASMRPILEELNKPFRINRPLKPISQKSILELDWTEFYHRVHEVSKSSVEDRLRMLDGIRSIFNTDIPFNKLTEDNRQKVAGLSMRVEDGVDWGHFGRMVVALAFKGLVNQNDKNISDALEEIPLTGKIDASHYFAFIEHFKKLPNDFVMKAGASRLLAMKRPDEFVCIDGKNLPELKKDFGYKKTFNPTYEDYWNKIIVPIRETAWYDSPSPSVEAQKRIWDARVAFVDAIYYDPN